VALIVPAPCDPPVAPPKTVEPLAVIVVAATEPPERFVAVVAVVAEVAEATAPLTIEPEIEVNQAGFEYDPVV
jgi:hypothetical protein